MTESSGRGSPAPAPHPRGIAPGGAPASGIEGFGNPADHGERAAISTALRGYLFALAAGDGEAACASLAAPLKAQVLSLGSSKTEGGHAGCAPLLTSMFARESAQARLAQRHTLIGSVRLAGKRAFALYRQPGMPPGFFPMEREEEQWRVAALGGSALPPQR